MNHPSRSKPKNIIFFPRASAEKPQLALTPVRRVTMAARSTAPHNIAYFSTHRSQAATAQRVVADARHILRKRASALPGLAVSHIGSSRLACAGE